MTKKAEVNSNYHASIDWLKPYEANKEKKKIIWFLLLSVFLVMLVVSIIYLSFNSSQLLSSNNFNNSSSNSFNKRMELNPGLSFLSFYLSNTFVDISIISVVGSMISLIKVGPTLFRRHLYRKIIKNKDLAAFLFSDPQFSYISLSTEDLSEIAIKKQKGYVILSFPLAYKEFKKFGLVEKNHQLHATGSEEEMISLLWLILKEKSKKRNDI